MKKPLLVLLLLAQIAFAQSPVTQDDAKAWMIQHFNIPADAKITAFFATGSPVRGASITWEIDQGSQWTIHIRNYDFDKQAVTLQSDSSSVQ